MEAPAFDRKEETRTNTKDASDDFAALREDVARLAESVSKLAANHLGTSVEDLQDKAGAQISAAERAIRRNPTQAALIAAGIGFLVGLIMIR